MSTVQTKAEHVELTSEAYHAHDADGSSRIQEFREDRLVYAGRYVHKTLPLKEPSPAMNLGTLVHLKVLEPDKFADAVADPLPELAPDGKKWLRRKGSDHEKWWADELAIREGKIIATKDTHEQVDAIAEAVLGNWYARRLLKREGQPEFSIFWTDSITGLELKCRVDWMAAIPVDLKTTDVPSPAEFARTATRLGYWMRAAHYAHGIASYLGEMIPIVHLVASTSAPYRVAIYDFDDSDRDGQRLGFRQWRTALESLARCRDTGDWQNNWSKQVTKLRPPAYAFSEELFEIGD